ncbi:MAG: MBL fold metallo-hydrolase, partial [Candidatus Absconditabacterales bacterium]|nr:MBL fold metallo-hydrolase [Candidatus Absconditabacterales bacterium]
MKINCLASSSEGNCYHISDGNSQLLLECGIKLKDIRKSGIKLTEIDGCLITHEHKDHSKFASEIVEYTHIYASKGTLESVNLKSYKYRSDVVQVNKQFKVSTFEIIPFEVKHDAKEPLGFLIYSTSTKEKLLFATDTYYIFNRFKGLNYIMVECNYSKDILLKNIDNGFIDKVVAKRLLESHFELENVKDFLKAQDLSKCVAIYLLHLSSGNSDEARFK